MTLYELIITQKADIDWKIHTLECFKHFRMRPGCLSGVVNKPTRRGRRPPAINK